MSCCPVTAEPARDAAPSVGAIKKYGETTLYVAGPANAKAGVIAYPDIFGLDSGRSKADADALGKLGYAVVLVDLVDGDYLDASGDYASRLGEWFKKHAFDSSAVSARVAEAIKYLQQEAGVERIASYGYCWGSWVGASQTATANPGVLAHVSFHPTWVVENMLKGEGSAEKLAEAVKVPQLLLAAGDDPPFVRENGSVQKILKARADLGAKSNVIDFPDQHHGWVHRGDLTNEATKEAVKKAWHTAIKFIQTIVPQ